MVGNEQLNRRRARFKPITVESVNTADVVQKRWNAINDEQDLEDKLQIAFIDALTTKMGGWIQRSWVMSDDGYFDFEYVVLNIFIRVLFLIHHNLNLAQYNYIILKYYIN